MGESIAPVSTHSRPKAADEEFARHSEYVMFQHTAARRRLIEKCGYFNGSHKFQHTAARRRLDLGQQAVKFQDSFNTQPPEGGCIVVIGKGA